MIDSRKNHLAAECERLRAEIDGLHVESAWLTRERNAAQAENTRLLSALQTQQHEIQQVLGRALGYPPCDESTSDVCVGEHTTESLADEAAKAIGRLRGQRDAAAAFAVALRVAHTGGRMVAEDVAPAIVEVREAFREVHPVLARRLGSLVFGPETPTETK